MAEVVAIDIGGTKLAFAVIGERGTVLCRAVCPTPVDGDAETLYAAVADGLAELVRAWRPATGGGTGEVLAGIGSAGPVNTTSGTISPVNIPGWREFPIRDRIAATLGVLTGRPARAVLAGDGHCIAVGEHWLGAGRDVSSLVGLVISTGIGAGAVLADRLFSGETGNALHIGHSSVNFLGERCPCGGRGCVEMYASGPAMTAYARTLGWHGRDARDLTRDAAAGDDRAVAAVRRGMRALAAGIAMLAATLDVRVFVVGGGVSRAGETVLGPLREQLAEFNVMDFVQGLEIRAAEVADAGLVGAAALALAEHGLGPLRDARRPD